MIGNSITRRLLLTNLLVLTCFLGLAGWALFAAYQNSAALALQERLQAHVFTLLATAQDDKKGRMTLPEALAAPDFNRPESGLYAQIHAKAYRYHWFSASLLGQQPWPTLDVATGHTRYRTLDGLAIIDQGIAWEDEQGTDQEYSVSVAIDLQPLQLQAAVFRRSLLGWLGGSGLVLLLVQLALIRWGLSPLRSMAGKIQQLESGKAQSIEGPVPIELKLLSDNLNSLIQQAHSRQQRVRNSLADLAHSLKTPLAVLRGSHSGKADLDALIEEQTQRINDIVSYQRQRAAVAGSSGITPPVDIKPIIQRLCNSLEKVHRERNIDCRLLLDEHCKLRADTGDLFELFGNLLENAYKHARHNVRISGQFSDQGNCQLDIEDDGEGIPAAQVKRVLQRGERADQQHPGQGIGLAVVNEIVRQYGATMNIDRSSLGGAKFSLIWPLC